MDEIKYLQNKCQIQCLPNMTVGYAELPQRSFRTILRFALRRKLTLHQVRIFKRKTGSYINRILKFFQKSDHVNGSVKSATKTDLKDGDFVKVLSEEEIKNSLNCWKQVKGCKLIPEMLPYCGTIQRVSRKVEKFVDEHDYQLKKSHGIIFLEGLYCQGTEHYGRCDRTCHYFWREEWLQKIDSPSAFEADESAGKLPLTRPQTIDSVRVRTKEEIEATLDDSRSLKGCTFMPEMLQYCDTVQQVSKRFDRFLDERDYHVKECHGVVLLDGVVCQGSEYYGNCDRTCHYLWREEWLKKVDDNT